MNLSAKGYKVFDNPAGYDLNIIGIRTKDTVSNTFNDYLCVLYLQENQWLLYSFPATTDPGIYYREHPINVDGTAIVKPGQYRGAYMVGNHKGYRALQQKAPITVFRDSDRDVELDFDGSEDQGMHAVNIHRANADHISQQVDKWSAGCQVIADPNHFNFLMGLCMSAAEKYGNSFTYTLLEESDFEEAI